MKFTIKDKRFIRIADEVIDFIVDFDDEKMSKALLRGLTNLSKIEENKTEFEYVNYRSDGYILIQNNLGAFITREDNVNEVEETQDILDFRNIKKIIKSKDKTIMLTYDDRKFVTTRSKDDEDDIEKAVMILLLKKEGYTVNEIYTIINSAK